MSWPSCDSTDPLVHHGSTQLDPAQLFLFHCQLPWHDLQYAPRKIPMLKVFHVTPNDALVAIVWILICLKPVSSFHACWRNPCSHSTRICLCCLGRSSLPCRLNLRSLLLTTILNVGNRCGHPAHLYSVAVGESATRLFNKHCAWAQSWVLTHLNPILQAARNARVN